MPRARTPTKVKELSGNPGKRATNKREPKPKGGPEQPPLMTKAAKKIWPKLVNAMPEGVYASTDSHLLAVYCEAAATLQHCASVIDSEDFAFMVKGSTGQEVVNQIIKTRNDTARLLASLGQRLGLDPAARQTLNADTGSEDDEPFASLMGSAGLQ